MILRSTRLMLLLIIPIFSLLACKETKTQKKKNDISGKEAKKSVLPKIVATLPVKELPKDTGKHLGKLLHAQSHGGQGTDDIRGLALDLEGNYRICGYFKGSGIFDTEFTSKDAGAYVAKISAKDGSVLWARSLNGESPDVAEALTVTPDGSTIVVGSMSGEMNVGDGALKSSGADDIFIAKFAEDGRRLWVKRIGSFDIDAAHAIVSDAEGFAYITGVYRGKVTFGETELAAIGDAEIFLTKLTPEGEFVWTKSFGEIGQDFGRDLAIDSKGNIILLSEISYQVSFGGEILKTNGNRDIALAKIDSKDGTHIWSKVMGNNYDDVAIGLAVDSSDNILFTGSFEGNFDIGTGPMKSVGRFDLFVAKFDTNGKPLWSKAFGGKDKDWGNDIAVDSFGNSYITGWFWNEVPFGNTTLTSKGKEDALLLKLSSQGEVLWAKQFGNKKLDKGKVVAVGKDDTVITGGAYNQSVDLGDGEMTPVQGELTNVLKGDIYLGTFSR